MTEHDPTTTHPTATAEPEAEEFLLPASFAQQRLWFLDQLMPGNSLYNIPFAVRFTGPLHTKALEDSLQEIVDRHEVLRTTFELIDDEVLQVIVPEQTHTLEQRNLESLPPADREQRVQQLATEEAARPFDLEKGPLLRTALLRLAPDDHVLLLTMHHIISDGWSIGVLMRELAVLYQAFADGQPSPLPELPIQYADYANWQSDWLQGDVLQKQLAYWKQKLAGDLPVLQLPADRPRPAAPTLAGDTATLALSPQLSRQLTDWSRREGLTLYMTLLAGFKTLLHRYTGLDDILVGSPIAGRNLDEIEGLIGFFVNTLVLRTDLSGGITFRELAQRVKQTALDADEHQDLPFEKLVQELQPDRHSGHSPLFQVMFTQQNAPMPALELPGLTLSALDVHYGTAKFDLSWVMIEEEHGLTCVIEYSTERFDRATIERLAAHYVRLLEAAVTAPDVPLADLPLLSDTEREQMLTGWNRTHADFPQDATLHRLFEAQAASTPDAIAVISGNTELTYRDLNARANQLARFLQKSGVRRDVPAGICLDRSPEMVIGLLGILKAGGAYVPIDPSYPADRIAYILEDASAPVLLTQSSLRAHEQQPSIQQASAGQSTSGRAAAVLTTDGSASGTQTICLDTDWATIAQEDDSDLTTELTPEDLAYLIYTSGSTGRPKGVMIPHRAICNHMLWMQQAYPLTSADRVLQKTPFGFDASVWEFWAPLLAGGQLVMAQPGGHQDSAYLVRAIREQQVTILQLVPTMLHLLLDEPDFALCTSLRHVYCGGEALTAELQERLYNTLPTADLHNLYGPTETCIDATVWDCRRDEPAHTVPIGRPIANAEAYVLDKSLQPVPVGVPGELHIGGLGLARGYWNRPDLTEKAFIPHPFSTEPGAKLYKTGDLVRYRPDGVIEYLDRIDNQVKLRGFRIELGEIEKVLAQHPSVREPLVLVREDTPGDKRLVAYLLVDRDTANAANAANAAPDAQELRRHLLAHLPEYMVPAAFVCLTAYPLTPNGKIDRRALPAPDLTDTSRREYAAPSTPTEQKVAEVWEDVLGLERVGRHDNFFELGGHSLLTMRVHSRLRSDYPALGVQDVFEAPSLLELAARLDSLPTSDASGGHPAITAESRIEKAPKQARYPLSHAQKRLWFLHRLDPSSSAYNVPVSVELTGDLHREHLEQALEHLLIRHDSLRTVFVEEGETAYQVIKDTLEAPALQVEDVSHLASAEQQAYVQAKIDADANAPFDLTKGPLVRANLFRLAADKHRLQLNLHHIITDGVSMQVLMEELNAAYQALRQGQEPALPPLDLQYTDYALWQERELADGKWAQDESYWLNELDKPLPVLELPTDRPRPDVQTFRGDLYSLPVPASLAEPLRELSRREQVSPFMLHMTAYALLLRRLTHQDDLIVGLPIAGRTEQALESLIGFFVNTLPIRIRFEGLTTVQDLLQAVKAQSLAAYQHQSYPFDLLIDKVKPPRDMSRPPIFSTMLSFANFAAGGSGGNGSGSFLGLQTQEGDQAHRTSKFDLTLIVGDDPEQVNLAFEYNTDLFDQATVQRFADMYLLALQALTEQSEAPMTTLNLLTEQDRAVHAQLNDTKQEFRSDATLAHLFAETAARHPNRPALSAESGTLTYAELDARANRIAHLLQANGLQPGDFVAIVMERSPESVISMLATLKAGGAYVPIDLDYPEDRIRHMLSDSGATCILTKEHHMAEVEALCKRTEETTSPSANQTTSQSADQTTSPSADQTSSRTDGHQTVPILPVDGARAAACPTTQPAAHTSPDDLAYLIYTSGSTGLPKGTMLAQRGVVNLAAAMQQQLGLTPDDTCLQYATFSFDAAVWEIFTPLLLGAHLHLLSQEERTSLDAFTEVVERTNAVSTTVANVFFKQMAMHITDEQQAKLRSLKYLGIGGEALMAEDVRLWQRRFGTGLKILNLYGPTEATVITTVCKVDGPLEDGLTTIPIGRPLPNYQVHILDEHMQLCPVGVPGEIWIGGKGLARGYLNQPEKTDEAFRPNPFIQAQAQVQDNAHAHSQAQGDRLYRTGDIGRLLPDGRIECLGRRDTQVKVRGFRIELGEIEAAMLKHPQIEAAAVTTCRAASGSTALAGFYTSANGALEAHDLKSFLASHLPDYMVPASLHAIAEMPQTPNGKVDRQALTRQAEQLPAATGPVEAPRTPLEREIASIWQKSLRVEQVGLHANFFDMGGDSILSMQVAARLNQAGLTVKVQDLFKHQTVAELAAHLEQSPNGGRTQKKTAAPTEPVIGEVPLSPIQQWKLGQKDALLDHDFSGVFLEIREAVQPHLLQKALQHVVGHHDQLRAVFLREGEGYRQIVQAPEAVTLDLTVHDLSGMETEEAAAAIRRIDLDLIAKLRLDQAPLMQAALFRKGDSLYELHWLIHHLLTDGYSARILMEDLMLVYRQLAAGDEALLPEKSASYGDWVQTHTAYVNSERGRDLHRQWKPLLAELAAANDSFRLPLDFPEGRNTVRDQQLLTVELDEAQTERLLRSTPDRSASLKEILLTSLTRALADWSGQQDIVLALQGHGRDALDEDAPLDLTRTVGWFADKTPFHIRPAAGTTPQATAQQVAERLNRLPHGGASFSAMRWLSEDASVRQAFAEAGDLRVGFNFVGQMDAPGEDAGLWRFATPDFSELPSDETYPYQLEIGGYLANGRLVIGFGYSRHLYRQATIQQLADLWQAEIKAWL